ncbi:RNA polymerase sigma factor SigB [compost metagenome]
MQSLGSVLDERELFILVNRYGIGDVHEKTLAEMAELMKLSKERVRQLEIQAIGKIRESEFASVLLDMWGDL